MAISDERELAFVQYLFGRIKGELTGQSIAECLGDSPRDRFHAGVLLPLEIALPTTGAGNEGSLLDGLMASATPQRPRRTNTESTMSMDCQVRLPAGTDTFTLCIKPTFSVYYAVYPTWAEVQREQRDQAREDEYDEEEAVETILPDSREALADPQEQETEPDLDPTLPPPTLSARVSTETIMAVTTAQQAAQETVVLPRKFRRRAIAFPPLDVVVHVDRLAQTLEIRDAFDTALAEARVAILHEDPEVWRHLGKPSEDQRELTVAGGLATEDDYRRALQAAATGELALPTWRAYMTVTGAQTLLDTDAASTPIYRLNVALINATPAPERQERGRRQLEEQALFDCGFTIQVNGAELVPFEFQGTPADYRYDRLFPAMGRNCVVRSVPGSAQELATESVPLYQQAWYRTRGSDEMALRFADLDGSAGSDLLETLERIRQRMDAYLAEWEDYLSGPALALGQAPVAECRRDQSAFAREIEHYALGIAALRNDARLRRAFELMNRVFRTSGSQRTRPIETWRLFQIAFMVTQLPTLAAREHDLEATDPYAQGLKSALERVDVLWFPTGGGKTEAYLGLIVTALFYDRLRGKNRGVTAWMRFPLRMLSLQQLERLADVLAQAELVRASEPDLRSGDSDPFAIGYYVGGTSTPNRIRDGDIPYGKAADTAWAREQIVRHCPFCKSVVRVTFDRDQWRLVHVCSNGDCYSNTAPTLGHLRGSLPIFVVDNEVYRYRPSVLVGTVDKLAILGFQRHFAHLVAGVTQRCPIHGYASFGQCVESIGGGPCKESATNLEQLPVEKDPVPALLIQDELHLLKEELGTFNAHYEGFLHYIAEKQGLKPSKVLAATATIEAYEEQIFNLYLERANRFPQPGWRAGESFYATSTPLVYRRLYSGVLTHQRSPESVALRALEIYHRELQQMSADVAAALANLGWDDVSPAEFRHFLHLYDLSLTYVTRKATGGNLDYNLGHIVSPRLSSPLTVTMLTGDNPMREVGQTIERIERERCDVDEPRLDVLIATSLISHGVDLERINFMCMVGMPSKYAEYIQASSRAARNHVGLVLVCFKRLDLREQSQFHYFLPNHRYLDRLVEAVPINRFAARAAERTIPGLLVGALLAHYSRVLYGQGQIARPLDNIPELRKAVANHYLSVEELRCDLEAIIGAQHPQLSALQRRYITESIATTLRQNWEWIESALERNLLDVVHPMLSFRDVDAAIDFIADGAASLLVERIRA